MAGAGTGDQGSALPGCGALPAAPRSAQPPGPRRRRALAASAAAERNRAAPLVRRAADAARHPAEHPPPGPFRPGTWRSPLRGLWLTSVLGVVLLAGLTILAVTGLLSYAAYDPLLPGNDQTPGAGLLRFYMFSWPTHPSWLYRVDQGVHITLGLALLPVVLAKLWSVLPRLFAWPPVRSLAQILERVSLIMLVGGVLFEFATGILDIQNYYVFPFSFYTAHLYGAWVFIAGLRDPRGAEVPPDGDAACAPAACAGNCAPRWRRPGPKSRTPSAGRRGPARGPARRPPARPDHLPPRPAGRGRRRLADPGRAGRRAVHRRAGPGARPCSGRAGCPRPPRTTCRSTGPRRRSA